MNRSSSPISQGWHVVLALCALVSSVEAQTTKRQRYVAVLGSELNRVRDDSTRALLRAAIQKDESAMKKRLILSPNGKMLLYCDANDVTYGLSYRGGHIEEVSLPIFPLTVPVTFVPDAVDAGCATFSRDGSLLACWRPVKEKWGQFFESITLFDTQTWKVVRVFSPQSNTICSLRFSRDGSRLISGNLAGGATIYDVKSGRVLNQWHYKNNFKSLAVAFAQTPTGEKPIALTFNGTWHAFNNVPTADQDAGADEPAQLWDIEANEKLAEFPELGDVTGVAFNLDGSRLAMLGVEAKTQHRDFPTYQLLLSKWTSPARPTVEVLPDVAYWAEPCWTFDDKNVVAVGVSAGSYNDWFRVFQTSKP